MNGDNYETFINERVYNKYGIILLDSRDFINFI